MSDIGPTPQEQLLAALGDRQMFMSEIRIAKRQGRTFAHLERAYQNLSSTIARLRLEVEKSKGNST